MMRFAASHISHLSPTLRETGATSALNNGIDLIQPNGFQLSSIRRQSWTNDAHVNSAPVFRKCNLKQSRERPGFSVLPSPSAMPCRPRSSAKKDTKKQEAKTKSSYTQVVLALPEKDLLRAATLERQKARFGFVQAIRTNLAKI